MKTLLTILLVASFAGVAVFGFSGMNRTGGQSHDGGCIAATSRGVDCPTEANPFDYVSFHLDAFRGFSTATFGENVLNAFLLIFPLLPFIGLGIFSSLSFGPPQLAVFSGHRFRESFFPPQKQELINWLALHENSPASL